MAHCRKKVPRLETRMVLVFIDCSPNSQTVFVVSFPSFLSRSGNLLLSRARVSPPHRVRFGKVPKVVHFRYLRTSCEALVHPSIRPFESTGRSLDKFIFSLYNMCAISQIRL